MFKTRFLSMLVLLMTAVTGAWAQSALTGFFTINAEGDQVQFSSGNLQATYDGTSWSWAFATNQWDYIGNAVANNKINGNGTVSENGTVDLFGWVGASSNYTGAAQYGIVKAGTTNTYGNVADESLKSDWGNTIGTGWRTLTGDEWTYLFNTRTTGGTVGTTAQARYTHATINTNGTGVNGMILFPDGVDIAASEFSTLGTVNGNSAWGTKCTATQWTALADKGCVFLPAAGNRLGATIYFVGNRGFYWSSSPKTSHLGYTYNVYFYSGSLNPQNDNNRDGGLSVRLVKPYERPTYTVSLNDGEENPTTWTAKAGSATTFTALPQDVAEGKTVTLKYSGTKHVKSVKAVKKEPWNGNLSTLAEDVTVTDGMTLTGTLDGSTQKYKITIAAGATVTLDNATINGVHDGRDKNMWAGINCLGNATIILKDGTTNSVKGFNEDYPGIHVPEGSTLTIKGTTGSLTASSNGYGTGIGGGRRVNCGSIDIQGGVITANGSGQPGIGGGENATCGSITISGGTVTATSVGSYAAGIGSGYTSICGNITIYGGTVTATGGMRAAGIGSGFYGASCGDITITSGVTSVTATKGMDAPNSIGAGDSSSCGTVTIGGATGAKSESPYTYPEAK